MAEWSETRIQYVDEVGSGRRAWPRAIKDRVSNLERLGVPAKAVAVETGISYETIITWRYQRRKSGGANSFHELQVRPQSERLPDISKSVTVTEPKNEIPPTIIPARALSLRLTTPSGYVIDGLDENAAVLMIRLLGRGEVSNAS